jgi:undecaprenyl diphosphate synthase
MKKPACIGFIMDGNRRFAVEQGLSPIDGHVAGQQVFFDVVKYAQDAGIAHVVFYAFSTENWQREQTEVDHLLALFDSVLTRFDEEASEQNVRIRIIGRRSDFSPAFQDRLAAVEEKSRAHTGTTVWVALSYGGRAEIVAAANEAVKRGQCIDEADFAMLLETAELPDPDMIVRTSGEMRLSNFLTWKSVYSELYFIKKHWPALTKDDFEDILAEYAKRQRRHGT